MTQLRITKSKIIENKNGEDILHLEITEVVLVHFNIVNNDYQQDIFKNLYFRIFI